MRYAVAKQIQFSYGHRLLKNPGKCGRLHGHNAVAEIHCGAAKLDARRMVVDFEEINGALEAWIDRTLDHRMILNEKDPVLAFLRRSREPCCVTKGDPTAEAIAEMIFKEAVRRRLPVSKVVLWETPASRAVVSR